MASLQPGAQRDQNARLFGALLGSARRRDREQLRSSVSSMRSARSQENQAVYQAALGKFRRADAIDRPTFYQNYKSAMSSGKRASEAIIKAAVEAGARDQQIIAYVIDDFCSTVDAFMMTSFGHESETGEKAKRGDELRALKENTGFQAQALGRRVPELRAKVESDQGGAFARVRRWLSGGRTR